MRTALLKGLVALLLAAGSASVMAQAGPPGPQFIEAPARVDDAGRVTPEAAPVATPAEAPVAAPVAPIAAAAPAAQPGAAVAIDGADTAWVLMCTVLVLLMTMPGILLFYSGMMRGKNGLSIAGHTIIAAAATTMAWIVAGYSLAFGAGTPWVGDASRLFAAGVVGQGAGTHPVAPTIPEAAFFMFELAFAVITVALVLGATVERMRLAATVVFAPLWTLLVYAPVAHWIWHPNGWLASMGHMDFAGGTVVHIASGMSGLAAAWSIGPRRGFGREAMLPHNLLVTVIGGGLLWAGWFGFNAGSALGANARSADALLATQAAACAGALFWAGCEYLRRRQCSVLGTLSGAIAGLIAVTPASGYVDAVGAVTLGVAAGTICFFSVVHFKSVSGIDDSLDVFALHGVGGFVGTLLTPVVATTAVAPVPGNLFVNTIGALSVSCYAVLATLLLLKLMSFVMRLRVDEEAESVGLDMSQHGEMLSPESA